MAGALHSGWDFGRLVPPIYSGHAEPIEKRRQALISGDRKIICNATSEDGKVRYTSSAQTFAPFAQYHAAPGLRTTIILLVYDLEVFV